MENEGVLNIEMKKAAPTAENAAPQQEQKKQYSVPVKLVIDDEICKKIVADLLAAVDRLAQARANAAVQANLDDFADGLKKA
ncbi:MAG: hypothetical protein Q4B40_04325 [Clostridia bacterium]|nr:hypothetical protein [Clostridia bacterium]